MTQLHVPFDVPNDGRGMLRNLPKAKRTLREHLRARGLATIGAPPLPTEPCRYAEIHGKFRVIVQWDQMPQSGDPRWVGRVDVLAKRAV